MNSDDSVEFGPFRLDPERRLLLRDGEPLALTPKTLDTLLVLVRERGRVVTKRELMERLWPDVVVDENNLTQQISTLRKILGERPDEGKYIRTVPGHGYRFVADLRKRDARTPVTARVAWLVIPLVAIVVALVVLAASRSRPQRSIAILPFKALGAGDEYLGIGMTDVLITRLSNAGGIVVRPTRAVRRFDGADVEPVASCASTPCSTARSSAPAIRCA
jgi:DNA-binding winged helix-turn-helix (wHTH) protein